MTEPPDTPEEYAAEFVKVGRVDWYVARAYNRLHWVDLAVDMTPERQELIFEYWSVPGPIRLACGRTAAWLHIPGVFTRMGAMRCLGCCRATGMPVGKGSPKNDDACRELLGLPTREESRAALAEAREVSGG